jgi:excinuclease ABC subunit B
MALFKLKSKFEPAGDQPEAIKKLVEGFKKSYQAQTLLGVTGSGKTYTMASLINNLDMPVLVIAPNKALAAQLYKEYKNFFPENSVNYFVSYYDYYQPEAYMPITDTYIDKESMINDEIERLRHEATSALLTRRDVIIVASVSCIYNLGTPSSYLSASLYLEKEKPVTRGDLIRQLVKMQFERSSSTIKRGQFRVRGDVFEIMPASEEIIYNILLKDQKVEGISLVDPLSRRVKEQLRDIIIFPPTHFISELPEVKKAIVEIKKELKERLDFFNKKGLFLEAQRLERRTRYDLEMIKSIGYCHGIENYSRHLTGKLAGQAPESLLSFFPSKNNKPDFLTIIDESHVSIPQIGGMYQGDKSRKEVLIKYGFRLPSALDNRPLRFEEFKERIGSVVFTSATPSSFELKESSQVVKQVIRPTGLIDPPIIIRPIFDNNKSQIDDLMEELKTIKGRSLVITLTKKMAEDLYEFLSKKGFKTKYIHSEIKTLERAKILTDFRRGDFDILIGVNLLREGLDLPEVVLVAILDADKEGFLRNETSLIQTMGRAARNVEGRVILYADRITGSIKRAVELIDERRKKQIAYNKEHNIIPKSIKKKVEDLIDLKNGR